jgi:hypothetical protein
LYARLRWSLGSPPIGVRYRCSQCVHDAMRWVHMHINMFLSGTDFWRYLDKAHCSVPGSGGSNPLHAIPCVHGLTGYGPFAFTAGFTRAPARVHGMMSIKGECCEIPMVDMIMDTSVR